MEIITLVFSGISSIAAVFSAIADFKAKKEVQELKQANNNKISQQSEDNSGNMVGINFGDINEQNER